MKVIFRTLDGLEAIKEMTGELPEKLGLYCCDKWNNPLKVIDSKYGELQHRLYILTQEGQDNFVYVEKA